MRSSGPRVPPLRDLLEAPTALAACCGVGQCHTKLCISVCCICKHILDTGANVALVRGAGFILLTTIHIYSKAPPPHRSCTMRLAAGVQELDLDASMIGGVDAFYLYLYLKARA
jgi:hypothetical protein